MRPRYSSLRDYLALFRRRKLVIGLVAIGFALLGLGASLAQSPVYTTSASVAFGDVVQDLPLIGGQGLPAEGGPERAARNAETITDPAIAREVANRLDTDVSPDTLAAAVTARVGLQTNFVVVEARWGDASFAADIANTFAIVAADRAIREERELISRAIKGLESRVDKSKGDQLPSFFEQAILAQISQLRAAKGLSSASEVTKRAGVPDAPVSPQPRRNTILGFLVGLAFGIVAAFARDSLDRRIRTARDVHEELDAPVLGRISGTALGSAGLIASDGLSPQDQESFRVLRTNLAFWGTEAPPSTVLITSGLAQEGKSTVAAALATASAAAGRQTLLVDCDLRRPTLADRLGLARSPGLAEYLSGRARPQEILQTRSLSRNGGPPSAPSQDKQTKSTPASAPGNGSKGQSSVPGGAPTAQRSAVTVPVARAPSASLVCVASGEPPADPAELLAGARCQDFLEKVSRAYELVVIDSSPMLATVDPLQLIPHVDAVLVVVRFGSTTREELRAVAHALARLPEKPVGIVLSGFSEESDQYEYYGYEA